jgi:polar amino acid transport system substrate-binding protein
MSRHKAVTDSFKLLSAALAVVSVLIGPGAALADDDSWQKVKDHGLVVCGVDGLLPYSSSDEKVPGFEVEIARAIAKELDVGLKQEWVSWDGLIPALNSGRCDAIINGMFITPEREKVIAFSRPYYGSGEAILVRKDNTNVKNLADLKGKNTGVLAGSVTVNELEKKGIGPLVVYPDQNTIIIELNNGRIDAAYLEAPSAAWALQKEKSLNVRLVEGYLPDERFNAAVGMRKSDVALKAKVDEAVLKVVASGAVSDSLKHYGVPFYPPI